MPHANKLKRFGMRVPNYEYFYPIDLIQWPRTLYFNHFLDELRCTYSITFHIDVTSLWKTCKARKIKFYAAELYLLTRVTDQQEGFARRLTKIIRLAFLMKCTPAIRFSTPKAKPFLRFGRLIPLTFLNFTLLIWQICKLLGIAPAFWANQIRLPLSFLFLRCLGQIFLLSSSIFTMMAAFFCPFYAGPGNSTGATI